MSKLFVFILFLFSVSAGFSQLTDTLKIYYSIDSAGLEGEWKNEIRNIAKKDIVNIKIYSYTDFLGTVSHNKYLSQRRANQVRTYLISQGVKPELITECKGMGIHPFSSNENRRNPDDRGILQHRVTKLEYEYKEIQTEKMAVIIETTSDSVTVVEQPEVIPIFANLSDENLVVGENIVLDNILFQGGTPLFKPESEMALKQLLLAMQQHPDLKIEIQGHICCQDDDLDGYDRINQNYELSSNRAKAVYDYLIEGGIDAKRMSYIGFGSKFKRFPEERSAREEDLNRRVEIYIVDK
ncbi:MAG: OmpA family protein [Bacteroidales bacterium]|nr:OmpA family protein [Bacteroidales bacterium]